MESGKEFSTPQEEILFWKERAKALEKQVKEGQDEFAEFQAGSRELEQELEVQLTQAEKSVKELRSECNRLRLENDGVKEKLESCQKEFHRQVGNRADGFLQQAFSNVILIREY
jgi:TolA-binding protein